MDPKRMLLMGASPADVTLDALRAAENPPHIFKNATEERPAREVMHHLRTIKLPARTVVGIRCTKCGFFVPEGASWVGNCKGGSK